MFKKSLLSLLCFSFVTLGYASDRLTEIDPLIEEAREAFDVPGLAVGVVVDGEILLANGYGTCTLGEDQPVSSDTLFAIGSCTKAFTTFVLGQLVEEGLVDWDEKVITYLPEFRLMDDHATHHLTVRDLLTHRSGLPRHDFVWYNADLSRAEIFTRLVHLSPSCDIREKFQYNNLMYLVAGLIIENVTQQSWEEAIRARIFAPLGMHRSNFSVHDSMNADDFSSPHHPFDGEVKVVPFRPISAMGPAGSINSSVAEMLPWIQEQLSQEPQLIQKKTLDEMHTLQTSYCTSPAGDGYELGYGLGWSIGIYQGEYTASHFGGIDGFISQVTLLPKKGIGIVVLTNNTETGSFLSICVTRTLLTHLLEGKTIDFVDALQAQHAQAKQIGEAQMQQKEAERIENTEPSQPLEAYVGDYRHPGYGTVKVEKRGGQLVAIFKDIETPLSHWQYDQFVGTKGNEDLFFTFESIDFVFKIGASGAIEELHIPFEPSVAPICFRR